MSLLRSKRNSVSQHPGSFDELLSSPPPAKKTIFKFALKDKTKLSKDTEGPETKEELRWQSPFRFSSGSVKSKEEKPLSTPKFFSKLDQKHNQELAELQAKNNSLNGEINNAKVDLDNDLRKNKEEVENGKQRLRELEELKKEAEREAKGPEKSESPIIVEAEENSIPDESDELHREFKHGNPAEELVSVQEKSQEDTVIKNTKIAPLESITALAVVDDTVESAPSKVGSVITVDPIVTGPTPSEETKFHDHIGAVKGLKKAEDDANEDVGNEGAAAEDLGKMEAQEDRIGLGGTEVALADASAVEVDSTSTTKNKTDLENKTATGAGKAKIDTKSSGKFGDSIKKLFSTFKIQQSNITPEEKANQIQIKHSSKLKDIKEKSESALKTLESDYDLEIAKIKEQIARAEKRIAENEDSHNADIEKTQAEHEAKTKELDQEHLQAKEKFLEETEQHIEEKKDAIMKSQERQVELAKELELLETKHAEQLEINKETEGKLAHLQSTLALQKAQISSLEEDKIDVGKKIAELSKEKELKLEEIKNFEEETTKHTETLRDESYLSQIQELESEISKLETEIQRKTTESSKLQDVTVIISDEIKSIQTQSQINSVKLSDLAKARHSTLESQGKQDVSLKELNLELEELKKDEEFARKEKELEAKIEKLKEEREILTGEFRDTDR